MKKVCKACGIEKERNADNFHRLTRAKDGFDYYCKLCRRELALLRNLNPEKCDGIREDCRRRAYKSRYGITPEQKEEMFVAQGRKCASCGSTDPRSKNGWMLDHDHETDKVRGVVCQPCNVALGQVRDSIEHLKRLIEYLQFHKGLLAQGATN